MNKNFLLRLLNVRPSEWKIVSQLFWLQFFMGTGIAFFFTASFSHFLEKFPASELAWVMIASAPLLFVTGWLFSRYEHRFHLINVGVAVITIMAISILLFQISSNIIEDDWFSYLTFAWYYVLYLGSNLCFWSITSTLFDVRQSKRLFAVISGGDIPAKFIGYTMAYFFVKAIGPLNLLWPAFFFMLASLPFLYQIARSGVVHHHDHHHNKEHEVEYVAGKGLKVFIKRYTLNTLIRRLAVLTFIISACLAIITYAFYKEIKQENHDDKNLANFIILFMAASQIIALLVKIIFTGRIVTSFGIKKSLLVTPLVLIALLALIIGADVAFGKQKMIIYAFGAAAIAIEVLRTAITNPVFLTVMQPLNLNARAKAHSIIKGIMDPFAFLLTGIMLIIINGMELSDELLILCYIVIILSASWIISIFLVNQSYHNTLVTAISSRYFSQDEFTLSDDEIRQQVAKKIETGNESEVINILQMLNSRIGHDSKELIFKLLNHPSDNIKKATIQLILNRNIRGAENELKNIADHSANEELQYLAVQTLCIEKGDHHFPKIYIHQHNPVLKAAALTGMVLGSDKENHKHAEEVIGELINSDSSEDKEMALRILTEVKDHYSHPAQIQLLKHDKELRKKAYRTIGLASSPNLLEEVLSHVEENPFHVLEALQSAEEKSIPVILKGIEEKNYVTTLKEKLIASLGKIGGHKAQHALFKLLNDSPTNAGIIAKALHRSHYQSTPDSQKKLEEVSFAYILYGAEILYMQNQLIKDQKDFTILTSSLNIELIEIRNTLIFLFGCLYDHNKAFKIKQGLDMKKQESIANALELIEMTVKKDLAIPFTKLFEETDLENKCESLKSILPREQSPEIQEIISKILSERPILYTAWTKACSLYLSKKTKTAVPSALIEKYVHSGNILLKETALFAQ